MDSLQAALALVLNPEVLAIMLLAGVFGLFVGGMPGLTATLAVALLVPVTFFMEPIPALAAIVSTTAMAIFAGDLPGALMRIPGTPASAAYVDDAYQMTQKGLAERALGVGLFYSAAGGLFGSAILATTAPMLAEVALKFSSFEYFWLACIGLSCAALVSRGSAVKGTVSLLLGLFISTIGIDITTGHPRFSFGSIELTGGVSFIPAMIGMFAVSEVLRWAIRPRATESAPPPQIHNVFKGIGAAIRRYRWNMLRGSAIGTAIGVLPGAGADIAAWIAYAVSKRFSREPEKYGSGHIEGIAESSSANNASLSGAWVPAMVFGIPGDSITAIVIGILFVKGMNPGPTVMLHQPHLLYAVFIIFFVANLMLLPLGWAAIKMFRHMLAVPREILMPIILTLCMVGAFAINNTVFGVGIILVLGVVAFIMEENGFPVAPTILGIVLGPLLEHNFITSMVKTGGWLPGFFERPIAFALGLLTFLIWGWALTHAALRTGNNR